MYGRCETDPFDQATDVCDSCYGEFCPRCLVLPKGRRHPICTDCAIIVSGVRPGARPLIRGSKRTADRRREILAQTPMGPAAFEYFEQASSETPGPTLAGSSPLDTGPRDELDGSDPELAESEEGATDGIDSGPEPEPIDETAPLPEPEPIDETAPHPEPEPIDETAPHPEPEPIDETASRLPGQSDGFRSPRPFIDPTGPAAVDRPAEDRPVPDPPDPVPSSSTPAGALPRRRRTDRHPDRAPVPVPADPVTTEGPGPGRGSEPAAVATAVADRPTAPLPKRRSTLRPDGEGG